ncbi:MAG: DHH family phosphoesterase, partial [Bullifex sp.]|nr:DHH family phosphoesterase [Bullifex sp.]
MKYELKRVSPEVPRRLVEKYRCDLLSATILSRRGITHRNDLRFYLENSLNCLHSPFLFEDMDAAVTRINEALEAKERICIFGDRDADGITATTLMIEELERLGADVFYMLPEGDDPYGLTAQAVEKIKEEKATLVITVDCGISCHEEIDALSASGIDTIVTDHHISGDEVPSAVAVIDPKVPSSKYPFEHLAGCGVAAKLIWALRFSRTKFYGSAVILLHALPGPGENTTTIIEAVQLENLVETARVVEEIPNGAVDMEHSRLVTFLTRSLPILVLDKDLELRALRNAFGKNADIMLYDIRPDLERVIPQT